jgi:DNA-binding NarL/FixJ family response regulator
MPLPTIRVAIASEVRLFREGLRLILEREKDIAVVAESDGILKIAEIIREQKPDILLLVMHGPNKSDPVSLIKEKGSQIRILVLGDSSDEELTTKVLRAGARGYLLTSTDSATVLKAIRAVYAEEIWVGNEVIARVLENPTLLPDHEEVLTKKELEIIRLIGQDYSNKEIAAELSLSEKTLKSYLDRIFKKLGVNSRLQVALYASKHKKIIKPKS